MYEAFFRLRARPFLAAPQTERYFPAPAIEAARVNLTRCIERAEGIGAIVGATGTGKTLLCQVLAKQLRGRFSVALLTGGQLNTRRALLQAVLFELGLAYRGLDESELRLSLWDYFAASNPTTGGLVLLVDEAHTLPLRLLDELRTMTNRMRDGQYQARIVLAGSPRLEEHFAHPKMESFSQRLAARCYLEALNREATAAFIRSQIVATGGDPSIFQSAALASVHQATEGIPRLINQLCDHALVLACAAGRRSIAPLDVDNAWADLQQLPAPTPPPDQAASAQVVEFGGLDDELSDLPEAIPLRAPAGKPRAATSIASATYEPVSRRVPKIGADLVQEPTAGRDLEALFASIDPFKEEFEDEEIVLDRYAPADSGTFSAHPTVSSREGRELAARLAPLTRPPKLVTLHEAPIACLSEPTGPTHIGDNQPITFKTSSVLWPAEGPSPAHIAADAVALSSATASADNSLPTPARETEFADDSDLIVVEDDPVMGATLVRAPLVRRQEYRQLFVTLRKGLEL